jgi:sulfonate transport system substrate-binding protein
MKRLAMLSRISHAALVGLVLGALSPMLSSSPARADQPLPSINLPIEGWTVVALKKGFLQEQYDKLGTKVNLVDPGTTQLVGAESALLDRGGLAIAQRMIYPATVHKANGIEASIVWLSTKSSEYRTPVLALKSSGLNSIADLKDKNFGSSRVACGWTSPTEIFTSAGLPLDNARERGQVRYTNISNTVATSAALLSGRIDATSTHVALPDVAALLETDEVKVIGRSPPDGVYVNNAGRVAYFVMQSSLSCVPARRLMPGSTPMSMRRQRSSPKTPAFRSRSRALGSPIRPRSNICRASLQRTSPSTPSRHFKNGISTMAMTS